MKPRKYNSIEAIQARCKELALEWRSKSSVSVLKTADYSIFDGSLNLDNSGTYDNISA